jgi:putative tryptophan/tyrosine transport system substrate-binding protein
MTASIGRRHFIFALGSAGITWPLAARAQQPAMPVIGFLSGISLDESGVPAFRQGLSETGYQEGRNISIQYRSADGNYDRVPSLAAELKSLPVSLFVAVPSSPVALAAKKVTSTIPIVFFIGADPVQLGLVASYNRPGGNATGIVLVSDELTAKRLELLHELVTAPGPIALLINPSNPNGGDVVTAARKAARTVDRDLIVVGASTESEIESAFAAIVRQQAKGLVVWQEAYFTSQSALIVSLAKRHAVPCVYGPRLFPEVGGLMSYGANRDAMYRLLGGYTGKILQGTKPADLPVMQPTKFELVINLKTAKALRLDVPPALLATADEVIE